MWLPRRSGGEMLACPDDRGGGPLQHRSSAGGPGHGRPRAQRSTSPRPRASRRGSGRRRASRHRPDDPRRRRRKRRRRRGRRGARPRPRRRSRRSPIVTPVLDRWRRSRSRRPRRSVTTSPDARARADVSPVRGSRQSWSTLHDVLRMTWSSIDAAGIDDGAGHDAPVPRPERDVVRRPPRAGG